MPDQLIRAMTPDGLIRVVVATTTDTVREALSRHGGSRMARLALARALTATALVSVAEKEFHRISVQWRGRGPLGSVQTQVRSDGSLRGYVSVPDAVADSLPAALGPGAVAVIEQAVNGTFTQGSLALHSSEVDEDLERWLRHSEQIPSRLRVFVDTEGDEIVAAAGVLAQTLPGGAADVVLDDGWLAASLLDRSLSAAQPGEQLASAVVSGELKILDTSSLAWRCECSQERVEAGVKLLGEQELLDMIAHQETAKVTCDFCLEHYVVDVARLCALVDELG